MEITSWRKMLGSVLWLVLALGSFTEAKYISGRTYLAAGRVNEITKFNFGVGTSHVNGTLEFQGVAKGEIYLFMDVSWWNKFHVEDACDKIKHAQAHFPIGKTGAKIGKGLGTARGDSVVKSRKNRREWSFSWQITHKQRTYGWYMVMADCSREAPKLDSKSKRKKAAKNRHLDRVTYKIDFLNPGGNHLSADEWWLTEIYVLTTALLIGGWFYFSKLMKKTYGGSSLHLVIKLVRVAYILQIVSMVLEIIHQIAYRYNGYGIWLFDFFSEVVEGFSQTCLSFVLLCLGNGWTISKKTPANKYDPGVFEVLNNPSLLDIDNPVLLLLILFMFISVMLQLMNKLYDDSFMKFHDHETYAGMILMLMRFVFGVLFFFALRGTINREKMKGAGQQFIRFLTNLMLLGSIWFLAFPLIVLIANLFAHYLRHFVVSAGVLVTQSVCLCLLSYEFGSNRSMFAKFSQVQQDGMLPGFSRAPTYDKFA